MKVNMRISGFLILTAHADLILRSARSARLEGWLRARSRPLAFP
jgi:hypothetical protein